MMELLLQMNMVAAILIVAIVTVRVLVLYKLPKKTFLFLWGVVAVRLLLPFRIPLPFNFFPDNRALSGGTIADILEVIYVGGVPAQIQEPVEQATPMIFPFEAVWLAGVCAVAGFFFVSYLRFHREAGAALPCDDKFVQRWLSEYPVRRMVNVRQTDRISSPLTYGILRPVILLPKTTDWQNEDMLRCILTHELVHIRHFDTLVKLVFAAAVCIHWFNPLVWVMYVFVNRDIELVCDEAATDELGQEDKKIYLNVLLAIEENRTSIAIPIASHFGKNSTKERISAIMRRRKHTLPMMISAAALVLCIGAVAVFALSFDKKVILFENMSQDEMRRYIAFFESQDATDYRVNGSMLYVPENRIDDYRWMVLEANFNPLTDHEYEEVISYGELGSQTYESDYILPNSSAYAVGIIGGEENQNIPPLTDHEYEEVISYGELGSQTYESDYILPNSSAYVVGIIDGEENQNIADYVEGDSSSEEKRVPITLIRDFEGRYKKQYRLIDQVEFSLTADHPSAVYEGTSDKNIVISFVDNEPVSCIVTIEGVEIPGTYKCGFSGEGAVSLELAPGSTYRVEYRCGLQVHPDRPAYTKETVNSSSGIIKVYEEK